MKDLNKMIARYVIYSQIASDGGKGIDYIRDLVKNAYPVWNAGYAAKDPAISKAIKLINIAGSTSNFRYYVSDLGKTYSYYADGYQHTFIVYFDADIEGVKYQVSFHSFNNMWLKLANKSHRKDTYKTIWDEADSRYSCIQLARYYGLISKKYK